MGWNVIGVKSIDLGSTGFLTDKVTIGLLKETALKNGSRSVILSKENYVFET